MTSTTLISLPRFLPIRFFLAYGVGEETLVPRSKFEQHLHKFCVLNLHPNQVKVSSISLRNFYFLEFKLPVTNKFPGLIHKRCHDACILRHRLLRLVSGFTSLRLHDHKIAPHDFETVEENVAERLGVSCIGAALRANSIGVSIVFVLSYGAPKDQTPQRSKRKGRNCYSGDQLFRTLVLVIPYFVGALNQGIHDNERGGGGSDNTAKQGLIALHPSEQEIIPKLIKKSSYGIRAFGSSRIPRPSISTNVNQQERSSQPNSNEPMSQVFDSPTFIVTRSRLAKCRQGAGNA